MMCPSYRGGIGLIREMTHRDRQRVLQIYDQSLKTGTATFTAECPSWEKWDAEHLPEARLVYELEGVVVGFAVISPTSTKPHFRGVVEVSVYVDLSHTGQGIGTALLSKLCQEAFRQGYWTIYSSIFPENVASVAIHEKCGFRRIGYREKIAKDIFGQWRDTLIMELRCPMEGSV